jgi:hypothetical protein
MKPFEDSLYEAHQLAPDCALGAAVLSIFGIVLFGFRVIHVVFMASEKPETK